MNYAEARALKKASADIEALLERITALETRIAVLETDRTPAERAWSVRPKENRRAQ